jgi:hypothetical protein
MQPRTSRATICKHGQKSEAEVNGFTRPDSVSLNMLDRREVSVTIGLRSLNYVTFISFLPLIRSLVQSLQLYKPTAIPKMPTAPDSPSISIVPHVGIGAAPPLDLLVASTLPCPSSGPPAVVAGPLYSISLGSLVFPRNTDKLT